MSKLVELAYDAGLLPTKNSIVAKAFWPALILILRSPPDMSLVIEGMVFGLYVECAEALLRHYVFSPKALSLHALEAILVTLILVSEEHVSIFKPIQQL